MFKNPKLDVQDGVSDHEAVDSTDEIPRPPPGIILEEDEMLPSSSRITTQGVDTTPTMERSLPRGKPPTSKSFKHKH